MATVLELARMGDVEALREKLEHAVRNFGSGRCQMTESEQLMDEALTCLRRGDLDEATHRLRLRAEPKWHDVADCKREYERAMKEKRARETA